MARSRFSSPRRGEPKVMQSGRFLLEPMVPNSHNVKREAIDPPSKCPVTINGVELSICIIFITITIHTQNDTNLLFIITHFLNRDSKYD